MAIYPLSGAVRQPAAEDGSHCLPRPCELRKAASSPLACEEDDDASLSLPHFAAALAQGAKIERLPAATGRWESGDGRHRCAAKPRRARCTDFPPPLDSPAHVLSECRLHRLQAVEKVRFTSIRSNGRLLVIEMPVPEHPRRNLHAQRCHGRLLIQLLVESKPSERREEEEEDQLTMEAGSISAAENALSPKMEEAAAEEDPPAMEAAAENSNPIVGEVKEALVAMASHAHLCSEKVDEPGGGKANGSRANLCIKLLKASQLDVLTEDVESSRPIQLHAKHGRGGGVACFLHRSLTRVRPLHVLSIWQT